MTTKTAQPPVATQDKTPPTCSNDLLARAMEEAEQGHIQSAMIYLTQIPKEQRRALYYSYAGYCLAHEQRQYEEALILCKKSIRQAPQDPLCYLNLGRVCLIIGHKQHAIKAFRQSLKVGCLPQVVEHLQQLGIRKKPPISSLPRGHFLNRYLGQFLEQFCTR